MSAAPIMTKSNESAPLSSIFKILDRRKKTRQKAFQVYRALYLYSPMRIYDVWNWIGQILDIHPSDVHVGRLTFDQQEILIREGEEKIKEYKKKGKWRKYPRKCPWIG